MALLNRFWTKWTSQKSTYCARAGELMVDKLTTVHQNTLALVAAGYLEGGWNVQGLPPPPGCRCCYQLQLRQLQLRQLLLLLGCQALHPFPI